MAIETAAATPPLIIATFDKTRHDRTGFTCGFGPIDNFLKSSLSDHVKADFVAAWVATEENAPAILGFYTLGAMAVRATLS